MILNSNNSIRSIIRQNIHRLSLKIQNSNWTIAFSDKAKFVTLE